MRNADHAEALRLMDRALNRMLAAFAPSRTTFTALWRASDAVRAAQREVEPAARMKAPSAPERAVAESEPDVVCRRT